jgi:hypothetical protein
MASFSSGESSSLANAGAATTNAEPITARAADRRVITRALGVVFAVVEGDGDEVVIGVRAFDEPIEMAIAHANEENVAALMVDYCVGTESK